ncbi:YL1 nuclear domain protein [Spraguea lophii 42_110]|uniref:YL1 nuclear domain protein n=1 Tax=Spraguea lophii (strain 42_110) TaxID=1358809 RepID=S7WCP1_SPRLO|nr:YL1 nuclear domain protein [Spraguea lophii 42_110]
MKKHPQKMATTKQYPFKNNKKTKIGIKKYKGIKQNLKKITEEDPNFYSLMNRISIYPPAKVCDITALPAKYTCPRTNLNYYNLEVFRAIRDMSPEQIASFQKFKNIGRKLDPFTKY